MIPASNPAGALDAAPEAIGWDPTDWEQVLHDARVNRTALGAAERTVGEQALAAIRPYLPAGVSAEVLRMQVRAATEALGRGVFARVYGAPQAAEGGPAWARAAARAVAESANVEEVRLAAGGDPDMAAVAAATLLRGVADQVGGIVERLLAEGEDPTASDVDDDALDAAAERAVLGLRGPAVAAVREVADGRDLLNGILPGLGVAPALAEQEDPRRLQLVERLRSDRRLRKVLEVAGRMHRIAERVRRTRSEESREEVVDVERGGDIGRILPSELAGLRGSRTQRLLVLKGIADRSLLQYELSGTEPLAKGPIVCLLDVSTSMDADLSDGLRRVDYAAAVGIACVRAGVEQRRDVTVATFNGGIAQTWKVAVGDRRTAEEAVLTLAGIGVSGGTSFERAIGWALDNGAERDRADLVLVTDGEDAVSDALLARLDAARGRGLRLWGILAGDGCLPDTVARLADGIATLRPDADAAREVGRLGAT